jgi:hypothetical protein
MTTSLANDRARSLLVRSVIALATGSALLAWTAVRAGDLVTATTTTLATGGVFGGVSQNYTVCYAFNSGTSPVLRATLTIRDQNGGIAATNSPLGCTVAASQMCAIIVGVSPTSAYSCTITTNSANAANLRGVMDMRDVNSNVLINSNLH